MQANRNTKVAFGILLSVIALAGWRRAAGAAAEPPDADRGALRKQVQQFQETLNRDLQTTFEHPFSLLQDAKGIYLPHYGVVFHMELNLAPLRTLNAFDVRPYTEQELQQARENKLQRIRELKNHLSDLLRQHASELAAVPVEQSVAIVVHLFNLSSERTEGLPMQIIVEVPRSALTGSQALAATAEEFRKSVSFFDF
jgi:hypothetical protein